MQIVHIDNSTFEKVLGPSLSLLLPKKLLKRIWWKIGINLLCSFVIYYLHVSIQSVFHLLQPIQLISLLNVWYKALQFFPLGVISSNVHLFQVCVNMYKWCGCWDEFVDLSVDEQPWLIVTFCISCNRHNGYFH